MSGHTYLLKSRHGVYYFRAVLPKARARTGRREIRISLRTKDRAKAKGLVALQALRLTEIFSQLEFRASGVNRRPDAHERDLVLVEGRGEVDLGKTRTWDDLAQNSALDNVWADALLREDRTSLAVPKTAPSKFTRIPQAANSPAYAFDERVEKAIARFVNSKKQAISAPTAEKYGAQCRVFLKIVAEGRLNLTLSQLTPKELRAYVDTLPKLPTRVDSSDCRPLDEILKTIGPRLSAKTIFAHAQATNMFLAWCEAQQYPLHLNLQKILKPLLRKPRIKAKEKAFSQLQLAALFESKPYTTGTFRRASDFWVPLLGLFTGAREAELCQLNADDVRIDAMTGLWLLDINSDENKRLKTEASEREVPLHPILVRLGFLDFVESIRINRETRLFKDEQRNKRGEFSGFSKRFNRFKEGLGIKSDRSRKLDFHSFRHTLQTMLFDAGEEEYVVNALCGHNPAQRSEGVRTYSRGPGLGAKYDLLLRLQFEIDFNKIKPNGWTQA